MSHPTRKTINQNNVDFLRIIMENTQDIVGITDPEGKILFRSENYYVLFGFTPEEMIGQNVFDFIHPDDQATIRKALYDVANGPDNTQLTLLCRYRHKDGHYLNIEVTGKNLIHDPLINGVLITYHDETKQIALISELEATNERYHALIESTGNLVWSVSADGFLLQTYNSTMVKYYKEIMGIDLKSGMSLEQMLPESRVSFWYDLYNDVLAHGPKQVKYPMATSERVLMLSLYPMIHQNHIVGISVFVNDETELVAAKNRFEDESIRYRTLIENMHDFVMVIDSVHHQFLHFNQAEARFVKTHYGVDLHVGMNPTSFLSDDQARFWEEKYDLTVKLGHLEFLHRSFKGDAYIRFKMNQLNFGKNQQAIMILGEDITDEEKYKQELELATQQLTETNQKLQNEFEKTIATLSKTVEIRDPYTSGHQHRVQALCLAIAERLDLSAQRINNIKLGSLVHDIGKIYVPSDLLNKPGKLTKLELSLIQTHAEYGYQILKDIGCDEAIPLMVRQHHERLDGSGYPNHLQKEEVLQESKILAVADVVEAMVSHRPYRPAFGIDSALKEINDHRDTKYDAQIVDVVIDLFKNRHFNFPEDIYSV